MTFTVAYLMILVLLVGLVIFRQVKKIENKKIFNERTMLMLWLILGIIGLITGGL
tara:strand:- start:222 stop:386 length:165 start_codon:yes stop_codon:yes gene_type:complete